MVEITLWNLNNKVPFTQDEIMISMQEDILDIKSDEICNYFFKQEVGKNPND